MPLSQARRILERIRDGGRLVADGGMGSELIRQGILPEDVLRVNLSAPEKVRQIHRNYLAAGAEILTANTFGLREADHWLEAVRIGTALAMQEAGDAAGEIGVWVSFPGSVLPREIEALQGLASSAMYWPGALLIETCVSLPQALEAVQSARSLKPALLAVTCHFRSDGRMPDSTTPETAAEALAEAGADLIGGNCGDTPETFVEVAERMRKTTDTPLLFQPGAGLPIRSDEGSWGYPVGPIPFAEIAERLFAVGAGIVGGCCGTSPDHIAAIQARKVLSRS